MALRVQRTMLLIAAPVILLTAILVTGCGKQKGDAAAELAKSPDYTAAMGYFDKNQLDSAIIYFEKITKALPGNPDGWAWYADVARRMSKMDEADAAAKKALSIDPDHAFANTVLGNLYFPQYSGWEKADNDTAWKYLTKAVKSDPNECNAWITVWIEALRRGDSEMEAKALEAFYNNKFFAPAAIEMIRWLLKNLPQNAILITNGDVDTYPVAMLQKMESLRKDIALVNINLLNTGWYPALVSKRYQLPLPVTQAGIDSLMTYYDNPANMEPLSSWVLSHWVELGEKLGRPIAFSTTCDLSAVSSSIPSFILKGAYYLPTTDKNAVQYDYESMKASLEGIDGKLFAGKLATELDKSPVRRSVPEGALASIPYSVGMYIISDLIEKKDAESAKQYIAKMRQFVTDAKMGSDKLDELAAMETKIK